MNIERHNYEEYFLMYADNELSAAEKKAVDDFVQQNPDLKGELLALQNSILQQEKIIFREKDSLKKTDSILQEKLLLYLDNELNTDETDDIERSISTDNIYANEFSVLQKTKLHPDQSIVHPDKSSLYKKEKTRVVAMPWKRIAAAAILIGFGAWGIVSLYTTPTERSTEIAGHHPDSINKMIPVNPGTENVQDLNNSSVPMANTETRQLQDPQKNNIQPNNRTPIYPAVQKEDNNIAANNMNRSAEKNSPANDPLKNISSESNKPVISNVLHSVQPTTIAVVEKNNSGTEKEDLVKKFDKVLKREDGTELAVNSTPKPKTVSLNESNDEESDNRILYIREEKLKNTKLGRLFGKVKNILNTKDNISTGNNIRVGNVEIAFH